MTRLKYGILSIYGVALMLLVGGLWFEGYGGFGWAFVGFLLWREVAEFTGQKPARG